MTRIPTLFLMADPDFWSGPARVFDLFGRFDQLNFSATREEADARALAADWYVTGDVLQRQQLPLPLEVTTAKR